LSFKIGVSGKGGTGKTTIAGVIIGYLIRKGKAPILAVAADANANLNEVLGIAVGQTIGGRSFSCALKEPFTVVLDFCSA